MSSPRLSTREKNEIVVLYESGRAKEAAEKFGVHPSYPRILARRREQMRLTPRQKRRIESLDKRPAMNHGE